MTSAIAAFDAGEMDTFEEYLTPNSMAWFHGLRSLQSSNSIALPTARIQTFEILTVRIVEDGLQERGEHNQPIVRDLAIVEAKVNETIVPFTLSQFADGWKLDLFSLGDVWQSASSQALPRL